MAWGYWSSFSVRSHMDSARIPPLPSNGYVSKSEPLSTGLNQRTRCSCRCRETLCMSRAPSRATGCPLPSARVVSASGGSTTPRIVRTSIKGTVSGSGGVYGGPGPPLTPSSSTPLHREWVVTPVSAVKRSSPTAVSHHIHCSTACSACSQPSVPPQHDVRRPSSPSLQASPVSRSCLSCRPCRSRSQKHKTPPIKTQQVQPSQRCIACERLQMEDGRVHEEAYRRAVSYPEMDSRQWTRHCVVEPDECFCRGSCRVGCVGRSGEYYPSSTLPPRARWKDVEFNPIWQQPEAGHYECCRMSAYNGSSLRRSCTPQSHHSGSTRHRRRAASLEELASSDNNQPPHPPTSRLQHRVYFAGHEQFSPGVQRVQRGRISDKSVY